jgi:hypothetical protein
MTAGIGRTLLTVLVLLVAADPARHLGRSSGDAVFRERGGHDCRSVSSRRTTGADSKSGGALGVGNVWPTVLPACGR